MPPCEYIVEGNPDGPALVFIHGWPDDASLWRRQVEALGNDYRCVLVTLPNFGAEAVAPGGFKFPELVNMLTVTIEEVRGGQPVVLVTHDWGAYLGYLLEQAHPELVSRMVALDIGGHLAPAGVKPALMIMAYQWALILCWLVGGIVPPLGNVMSKGVGKLIRVPDRQRAHIRSRCNYPYFYLWRGLLLPWRRDELLGRYRPKCPVLYLYGARKPLMFHSPRWLEIVADSGGRAAGVEGAGHWLQETHPERVNREIRDFLAQ